MNATEWLKTNQAALDRAGIGTARLDCLVLLEDASDKDRAWLLAHPDHEISPAIAHKLMTKIKRRASHEPLAYIRGKTEFYGRDFKVDNSVLEPRPESETMIELLKSLVKLPVNDGFSLADIGSGSGAIGITAALELCLNKGQLFLHDIDKSTIAVAKQNAWLYKLRPSFLLCDLLENYGAKYDVIVANLPYVPDTFTINEAALHEPKLAIFGGHDGLDLYRRMFKQLTALNWRPKFIMTEAMPPQHKELTNIAASNGFKLQKTDDFIQVFQPENN